MVRFYDPIDRSDQNNVELVLRSGGIEYFLRDKFELEFDACQILVAEEDIPRAEKLLANSRH
jgi:hypothetical protein